MRNLQAILSTGSLPVRLEVVKTDSISPALGAGFIKNAVIAGIFAIIAVCAIIAIRYKEWRITIPIIITILSEVILILGFAALIGWRMDIAAIAAIIIAVGSGVDDQIIISDETLKTKIKRRNRIMEKKSSKSILHNNGCVLYTSSSNDTITICRSRTTKRICTHNNSRNKHGGVHNKTSIRTST